MTRSVAVLMTAHNRCAETVLSAQAILAQAGSDVEVDVFLTDDGSTDGTAAAVSALGPRVHVIQGDGYLFWAAGMALSERAAMRANPDYLLWLNDDTVVDEGALGTLLSVAAEEPGAIVVGATRDPLSGEPTYGARIRTSTWHPQRFVRLPVRDTVSSADTFNGNLVLVPIEARRRVGPIDDLFPHAYADDDYGLRASAVGVRILQAPGTLATCRRVSSDAPGGGLSGWRGRQEPKGLPWRAQVRFMRRHAGPAWPVIAAGQQLAWLLRR